MTPGKRSFNWQPDHIERIGPSKSFNSDIPVRSKTSWSNGPSNLKLSSFGKKENHIERRISVAKTDGPKKKFGTFMGGLLLKRKNDEEMAKTSEPKTLTEKTLKQKVLTEEPYLDLFRVRKSRLERPALVPQFQPIKKVDAIKFSLKFDDIKEVSADNRNIVNSASQKHQIVNGRRTRWDVQDSHHRSVSTVTNEPLTSKANDTGIEDTADSQDTSHRNSVITNTNIEGDSDDNDELYSIDSLQSDDDVLEPWIELGMIDPSDKSSTPEDDRPTYTDCAQCIENSNVDTREGDPFQTVAVCSNCQVEWKNIFKDFSTKAHAIVTVSQSSVSKKNQSRSYKLFKDISSAAPKESLALVKKTANTCRSIPPTKSSAFQKAKRKTKTNNVASSTKTSSLTDKPEDHITTGAFMTRKTAKVLAGPFGFYPNPHGFIRHQRVEVLNINGRWYRGTLEMMNNGKVMVQYDDWDDQEWIIMESRRLRILSKEDNEQIARTNQLDISDKATSNMDEAEVQDHPMGDTPTTTWLSRMKKVPGAHRNLRDDYISHALDKDPTQIFNNNEVFMTRRMARELVDEYGFKPNLFGYRRNRAVAITVYSKKIDGRKGKEECIGYLREMHRDQVRVWYPDHHISEWLPIGSRRLRVMTKEEEEAVLLDNKVDLVQQETLPFSLDTNKTTKIDLESAEQSIISEASSTFQKKNTNVSSVKKGKAKKAIAKGSNNKALVKQKNQEKAKTTAVAIMTTIRSSGRVNSAQKVDDDTTLNLVDVHSTTESEKKKTADANATTNDNYLTTGAFATRRAMRQLKDKNGFTPNPYGYKDKQLVEILNTRSGKSKFWERGTLVAMRPGQVKVHYEGWTDDYDEWLMVGSRRIRITSEDEVENSVTEQTNEPMISDVSDKSKHIRKDRSKSARNELLMAESNPELTDEVKKNRKRQIVLPQDYHRLGLLINLDEEAIKEAQKKERKEKRRQLSQNSNSNNGNVEENSEDESEPDEEYIPETCTPAPKRHRKKKKKLKSSTSIKRKRHFSVETSESSRQESDCCSQSTSASSKSNDGQIISLRLAQAKASERCKFVANVYGYDYMQHVTVLHLDKKLYEGRLVAIDKNKVKVHYCGWLDMFDEYITLGSRRIQPIENDHEVECIEPNYRERHEQMGLEQSAVIPLENPEVEVRQAKTKLIRKRLTLEDDAMENDPNCERPESHKDADDEIEEEVDVALDASKVYCNQCSVIIKQFRYYCTYCETPSVERSQSSFELCLGCFDQNFPFWHEHPRSSFAFQSVIDSEIGPRPIKGELVTVWEEDILENAPTNDTSNVEQCSLPFSEAASNPKKTKDEAIETINFRSSVGESHIENSAIDASKVFSGTVPIETDQGYKYLKRWKRRKVCAFCNDDDDTSEDLGAFIGPFVIATFNKNGTEKKRSFWAHDACARYTPEVFCTPEGKWYNVTLALRRGRGMRCHGCKEKGATIGCFESKCSKSFHLPCAQKPVSNFKNGVIFWCSVHEAYYNKKDTYVNKFNCDGCSKELVDESWFTCVPCASSYFSSFDLCAECFEKFPSDHAHNEDQFEETSFEIIKEMEAQKATEAARAKEKIKAANAQKKKKSLFPRRRRRLADGSMPVSCCYCGTYEADSWRKGYDGGVVMCNPCFELASLIDNDGKSADTGQLQVIGNSFQKPPVQAHQHEYAASIEDYSHKPYLTRDALSSIKFSETSTGSRLASYEPQANQLFSLTFDSTYFDIPGRAPRWATHSGTDYHGTWLPQTVRRAILKYTSKDDRVLSNFLGRGTDAIECFLLQRKCCGVDINPAAVALSQRNCCFEVPPGLTSAEYRPIIAQADSRQLSGTLFSDESYHHILSHPPYKDCVAYSTHLDGDLSRFTSIEDFKIEYSKVVEESWRLLKMSRRLTLGIGDNREHCFYVPVSFQMIRLYIDRGFELEELIIKRQRYCSAFGLGTYLCVQFDFLVFTHEFIATFKKSPREDVDKMFIQHEEDDAENVSTKRAIRGIPPSAIMRKSVVMGTVWVFKPTPAYKFSQLCISRMVERFGQDDHNWEHIELKFKNQISEPVSSQNDSQVLSSSLDAVKEQEQVVQCPEDEDPLSHYEQQRLKRIEENNKTLLKLGLISELSEDSDDIIHYDIMMKKLPYANAGLALMVTSHMENILPINISVYRQALLRLATEAAIKLAHKGMLIIGTQDIRDPITGKLWPMTMLVLEDIEAELGRDILRLKEMVVTVPEGYSKLRKDFQPTDSVLPEGQEEEKEEDFIDIETIDHGHVPIVHAVYLIFQKI